MITKQSTKKLSLVKITIQDLDCTLDRSEQQAARGGSVSGPLRSSIIPVICY